jgi:hypothetical protein
MGSEAVRNKSVQCQLEDGRGDSLPIASLGIWGVSHSGDSSLHCRPAPCRLFQNEVDSLEAGIRVGGREEKDMCELARLCFSGS